MEEDGYRFPSPSMSSHLTGSNAVNLVMRQMLQNAKLGEQEAIARTTSKFKGRSQIYQSWWKGRAPVIGVFEWWFRHEVRICRGQMLVWNPIALTFVRACADADASPGGVRVLLEMVWPSGRGCEPDLEKAVLRVASTQVLY